jgi:hypothetical protein
MLQPRHVACRVREAAAERCAAVCTGHEAAQLEAALGMAVIRHTDKKPAGEAAEVAAHFGCQPHQLLMVGDRWVRVDPQTQLPLMHAAHDTC